MMATCVVLNLTSVLKAGIVLPRKDMEEQRLREGKTRPQDHTAAFLWNGLETPTLLPHLKRKSRMLTSHLLFLEMVTRAWKVQGIKEQDNQEN